MKLNVVLSLFIIVLAISLVGLFKLYTGEKNDRKRHYSNLEALAKKIEYNSDSTLASTRVMSLKRNEVENLFPEVIDELHKVNLNVRNVILYQQSAFGINARFMSHLIDSLRGDDTLKFARFSDKYISFIMEWGQKDTVAPTQFSLDVDLQAALHKKRKDGVFGFFKPRIKKLDIWTYNPYVKLKYNKTIEFTR